MTWRLKLVFEGGVDQALWAADEATKARFGYPIDLDDLPPLPTLLRRRLAALAARAARGDHPPPGELLTGHEPAATPWSAEVSDLALRLGEALGPDFAVEHDFDAAGLVPTLIQDAAGAALFVGGADPARSDSPLAQALDQAAETGAALEGAVLTGIAAPRLGARGLHAPGADLSGAILAGADLSGADLSQARLTGADLRRANLAGARLAGADVEAARLDGADLSGAEFGERVLAGRMLRDEAGAEAFAWATPAGPRLSLDGESLTPDAHLAALAPDDTTGRAVHDQLVAALERHATLAAGPVDVRWKRGWLMRAAPGSLALGVLSAWFASDIAANGLSDWHGFSRWLIFAVFAAFGLLLTGAGLTYLVALFDPRAPVTLGPEGLRDRRLTARPVPWNDLLGLTLHGDGGQAVVALNVARPGAYGWPANPLWIVNRLAARLLGRPQIGVKLTGLDTTPQALVAAIQAFAAQA